MTAQSHSAAFARAAAVPDAAGNPAVPLPTALLRAGLIRPEEVVVPFTPARHRDQGPLLRRTLPEGALLDAAARHFRVARADLRHPRPEGPLIDALGAQGCLRLGLVPWRRAGAATVIATSRPEDFARQRPWLEARLGPVLMALAPAAEVEEAILACRGARLARGAENRVPNSESCRGWGGAASTLWALAALSFLGALFVAVPLLLGQALLWIALAALLLATALKLTATLAALRALPGDPPVLPADLPTVSIIVALYRESDIAPRLVRRLSRLDYPRDRLDVLLAVEAEDTLTRTALARASLPPWMRVVVAPDGRIKTKPRALNLALDQCRGSIVGIYDAEDAPEPAQIRKVVARFHAAPPQVACLQGRLDYYNPRTNWLSRCFTLEYASWFRLVLPGIARLGLAVPLGGTTLFFRREVLERLGGWDAHNVTEDADLGVRLYRHGYRTEIIDTTTGEEANCRAIPWVKQRSRWIKGYMMTWAVHMRDPRLLWRQLGPRAFCGFQVMFAGSILQFLLAPLLWSFWVVPLGLPHPLATHIGPAVFAAMTGAFLLSAVVDLTVALIALRRSGHRLSPLWAFTLHGYFPLATFAAYKALWEAVTRPFYWDKTSHGHFDGTGPH